MTITEHGELSIGAISPGALASTVTATASIEASLPNLEAQLAGLIQAQIQLSLNVPDLAAQLDTAIDTVVQILIGLSIGIPAVDVQGAAIVEGIATLVGDIGTLNAQFDIALELQQSMGASIVAWSYNGPTNQFTNELAGFVNPGLQGGSPTTEMDALVIATTNPVSWEAMRLMFAV